MKKLKETLNDIYDKRDSLQAKIYESKKETENLINNALTKYSKQTGLLVDDVCLFDKDINDYRVILQVEGENL